MTQGRATRVVVIAPGETRRHDVAHGETAVVGRARDCDLRIDLPSISRHHARITAGPRPEIEDLGGTHGVRVAGRKARVGDKVALGRGDVVDLGGALLLLHDREEPALARWDAHLVEVLAETDMSVVLFGEPGVGKTRAAQALVRAAGGDMELFDDVVAVPEATKTRFVATSVRHDLAAPERGVVLFIPPLRDRPREIAPLATRLLEQASMRAGRRRPPRISREALGALVRHPWLGNVRELERTMEHALVLSEGREIEPIHLAFESAPRPPETMQTLPPVTVSSSLPPSGRVR